jgi:hypothetical protein
MARPATGQVVELRRQRGRVFALRLRAYGRRHYITLDAASRAEAETELANVLADVRRGIWQPSAPQRALAVEPTFHVFASEWLAAREHEGLATKTIADLRWSLCNHLLPFFARHRLSEITAQEVDRYRSPRPASASNSSRPGRTARRCASAASPTTRSTTP